MAYGVPKPVEDSVKMMHSQIQVLFEIILKFISQRIGDPKNADAVVKRNLYLIFHEEASLFESISKQYKKATRSVKKNENAMLSESSD